MARYRKIEVRIWNDEKFRGMSDRGKLAFLFLLTHPHMTGLGAMRGTIAGLAAELGWPEKGFREAFREALSKGIAKHDENTCFIALPNFIKHNPPENPNVVTSWKNQIDLIPEGRMKDELMQQVKAFTEGLGEGFRKAFAKAFPEPFAKGMANQEQEQEQEQEHKQEQEQTPLPPSGELPDVAAAWNSIPGVIHVRGMTKARSKSLTARLTDREWAARWMDGIERVGKSAFCQGGGDTGWKADLDWFLKPDTLTKILEGKYDNRNGTGRTRDVSGGAGANFTPGQQQEGGRVADF